MVYVVEIFIFGLFLFIAAELLAKVLPKSWNPTLILRGLTFAWIGWSLFNVGALGTFMPPAQQTVANLLEQARGDQLHWNEFGKPATRWEQSNHRHYERTCRIYAIEQLGKLGLDANEAVPELVELINEVEDYNSGDGVYELQSKIARTLGEIGDADAIEPLIGMLVTKSISPDPEKSRSKILWHSEEFEEEWDGYRGKSRLKRGTGPQAILMGLMSMPFEHHDEIAEQLKVARAKIEKSELFNAWSKSEIDRGLRFFAADEPVRARVHDLAVAESWCLNDASFEKYLDPNYQRPKAKSRILLCNGQWSKEISTPEERKEVLALNRKLKRSGQDRSNAKQVTIRYLSEESGKELMNEVRPAKGVQPSNRN